MGDNKLSGHGHIPEWIGENLKSLVVLRLHKNKFTRRIHWSLCKASLLNFLDIAHNNLKGHIPRCQGELNLQLQRVDLEYKRTWLLVTNMDLSSNQLVG